MSAEAGPSSVEEALAQGFKKLPAKQKSAAVASANSALADGGGCLGKPAGAKCFDFTYPNGRRVVGYCNGNHTCVLYYQDGN